MNKLLTIAIPTYNRANLLDKQLAWLAQAIQGFEADCEIFVSDNCSTDHTQEVIDKWQGILTDIPFINNKNSENIGLRKNIAHCINSAKTKYVWTVGDDDPIQHSAVNYVLTKLRKHKDLSLLFLNFSGRDKFTGQTTGAWFETDTDSEDGRPDGKALFEGCFYKNQNAVIFITSSVYRTERAQQALRNWKNATDNWLYLAYVAGYCASTGSVIVTKDTYIECIIGVSHWQADSTAPLFWNYKHIPEVIMKLKEIGYSKQLYNRMIFQNLIWNLKGTNMKFLLSAFKKWPVLTMKIVSYFLFTASIAALEKMLYFKDTDTFIRLVGKVNSMLRKVKRLLSDFKSYVAYRTALLKHKHNLPLLDEHDRTILDTLKREGICITTLQELDLPATSNLLNASSNLLPRMGMASDSEPVIHKRPEIYTVTDLPAFYNWGKEQRLLNIIENYIGLPVAYHGVHLRKDFPNKQQFGTLQWHRDSEDRRMLKIIIYLSDVGEENAPFQYIPLSLTSVFQLSYYRIQYKFWRAQRSFNLGIHDEILEQIIPESAWKSCLGPAGTVIFVDTGVLFHHGTSRTQERSTQFFVYTANPPKRPELCTQYWDNTFPKPDLHQESESIQSST